MYQNRILEAVFNFRKVLKCPRKRGKSMDLIEFNPTDYPSDLTDTQWEQIEEYFPQNGNSEHHKRSLINAVLYLVDNGIKWRSMPHDYPPWSTVHSFYFRAIISGLWERVQEAIVRKVLVA